MKRAETRPGQESVWDYPRPPRIEATRRRLQVVLGGEVIAETDRGFRVLETSHPPVYFFPPEDVRRGVLRRAPGTSLCEWKGQAVYFDVVAGGTVVPRAAWSYPRPTSAARSIASYVAFYAGPMDRCTVDGETVVPQPGRFYGGWVTSDVAGPFKGDPGTEGW